VLASVPGVNDLVTDGDKATFTVGEAELGAVLSALAAYSPRSLISSPPSLEDLFLRHYGGVEKGPAPVGSTAAQTAGAR
jgi:ABC-2 type transport system ATP-binding protein